RHPITGVELAMTIFLAVVAAAATEELIFRGVMLRWQLSRALEVQLIVAVLALTVALVRGATKDGTIYWPPALFVLAMFPGYVLIPSLCRRSRAGQGVPPLEDTAPPEAALWPERFSAGLAAFVRRASDRRVNALLAIYGNGLLFAAIHSSVWPTP